MDKKKEAVLLVGHGAPATDTPREYIEELKRLESQRVARHVSAMSEREAELDRLVREWPRTQRNDAYKWGLEEIADKLRPMLKGKYLVLAYNEFCFPSVEQEIRALIGEGYNHITLISTMFTRGGIHSEYEIPQIIEAARRKYPYVTIEFAWPYDIDLVGQFLAAQLKRHSLSPK